VKNNTGVTQTVTYHHYFNDDNGGSNVDEDLTTTVAAGATFAENFRSWDSGQNGNGDTFAAELIAITSITSNIPETAKSIAQTVTLKANNSSATTVQTGGTIKFEYNGAKTSCLWNISPSSSEFNPSADAAIRSYTCTFSTAGTYTVTLSAPAGTVGTDTYLASNSASVAVTVAKTDQTVSSADGSITAGQSFTPTLNGGAGSGAWRWSLDGGVSWQEPPAWSPAISSLGAGSYGFYVRKLGDATYNDSNNAGPYTLTVTVSTTTLQANVSPTGAGTVSIDGGASGPAAMATGTKDRYVTMTAIPTSGTGYQFLHTRIYSDPARTAQIGAENGNPAYPWMTQDYYATAFFGTSAQTVFLSGPTTATVGSNCSYTASGGNNGYAWGGSASGSGASQSVTFLSAGTYSVTAYSPAGKGWNQSNTASVTVTVNKADQTVSSANGSITAGQSFTPTLNGGAGSGAWRWSFDGGVSWQEPPTWSPAISSLGAGSYNFYVRKLGDATYNDSNNAGPYTLTITAASAVLTVSVSPSGAGQVNINGGTWGGSAMYSGAVGRTDTVGVQATSDTGYVFDHMRQVGQTSGTAYDPCGLSPYLSESLSGTVYFATSSQTVTLSGPATATVGASVTYTASGGNNGYVWGGSVSGSGVTQSISFPSAGTYTVTAYSPAGKGWAASNTASATVIVSKIPTRFSFGALKHDYSGSTATATVTALPLGATYSADLAKGPAVGSYTVTAVANGNYSGSGSDVLIISQHPITVSAASPEKTYDGSLLSVAAPFLASGTLIDGHRLSVTSRTESVGPNSGSFVTNPGTVRVMSGSTDVSANYAITLANGSAQITRAPQTISVSTSPGAPISISFREAVSFTASGGQNSYLWSLPSGTSSLGSGDCVAVTFPKPGHYGVTVQSPAGGNYEASNSITIPVSVTASVTTLVSLEPLVSDFTVNDSASPAFGRTYKRVWLSGSTWAAYLGRTGVRFKAVGHGLHAARSFELQTQQPGGAEWTTLSVDAAAANGPGVDVEQTFSVRLGEVAPGAPLIPLSYAQGSPATGTWRFRARVQDSDGSWSQWTLGPDLDVQLPIALVSETLQTLPPAGPEGKWYTSSDPKTFVIKKWIP
jgi:hypothetical protein